MTALAGPAFTEWTAEGRHLVGPGGFRIFARQDGPADGRPVTLIHGFPTSSHDWRLIVGALHDGGCRTLCLDLLGFGASAKPAGHVYSILEQADVVEAVWREFAVVESALVAHDYGVTVAQELLARDPGRISRAAFLNGGLYPDLHRPIPVQRLMHGPAGVVLARLASERTLAGVMDQICGRRLDRAEIHEMWEAIRRDGGAARQHALLRYIDERRTHAERWTGALERFGAAAPTRFIWGPADPISGAHVIPRLRERVAGADVTVLDGPPAVGHYPQLEAPELVAGPLAAFLAADG